jgi:syntaxin 7
VIGRQHSAQREGVARGACIAWHYAGRQASMSLDDVVKNIGIISRNNGVLAGMQASGDDARELRTLLQDTGALARETSERLMSLQRGQHASGMPARQRTMLNKLNKDFEFVLRRFQKLAQSSANSQRRPANSRRAAAPASAQGTLPSGSDDDPSASSERRGLLAAEQEEEEQARRQRLEQIQVARATQENVVERERAIKQIETTVSEVNEIFIDLGKLVAGQTEQINTISSAIENTVAQTVRAREELQLASRSKSRLRSRLCCLMLGSIIAGLLLVIVMNVHW